MKSKGNPYVRKPIARRPIRARRANRSKYSKTIAAHYGMPIQTFKDSDRDGVMNGLDCKPYNKRKQDVRRPRNTGYGGTSNMYARKEQARFTRNYMKQLNEIQRQEYQRLMELQRIQTPVSSGGGSRSSTPVILVDGKWEKITSAAGKAKIKKDEAEQGTAINPPIGSNNSGYQTGTTTYRGSTPKPNTGYGGAGSNNPDPRYSANSISIATGGSGGGGSSYSYNKTPTPKAPKSSAIVRQARSYKSVAPKLTTSNIVKSVAKRTYSRVRSWFRR